MEKIVYNLKKDKKLQRLLQELAININTNVVYNRLHNAVGNKISTHGRSCNDNLFSLQQILEERIRKREDIHLVFEEEKKSRNLLPRDKHCRALHITNSSCGLIRHSRILKRQYFIYWPRETAF